MRYTLLFTLFMFCFAGISQTSGNEVTVKSKNEIKSLKPVGTNAAQHVEMKKPAYHVKLSTSGNSGVTRTMTPEQEIDHCNSMLEALDQKEAHIRSTNSDLTTPELTKWFSDADATRISLRARIEELK